ncbi:MAG: SDR family oxidoreductase [Pseudomonadota bacterium]
MHNKWVLITGAGKRIGKELAIYLAKKKYNIVLHHYRSEKDALETQQILTSFGSECILTHFDLTKAEEIKKACKELGEKNIHINTLINNASIFYRTAFDNLDEESFDTFMSVNAKGPYLLSLILGKKMRTMGTGNIINITCESVKNPFKGYLPYSVSKACLDSITKALAKELAPQVRVNSISPGPILAPEKTSKEEIEKKAQQVLLKRWGKPEDICKAVHFLMDEELFVTGIDIPVNGQRFRNKRLIKPSKSLNRHQKVKI